MLSPRLHGLRCALKVTCTAANSALTLENLIHPAAKKTIGVDVRTLKDATGKVFGQGLYDGAKEGQITEVSYMFPKPGTDTTPVAKISLVTKVGDLGCGVGYYK